MVRVHECTARTCATGAEATWDLGLMGWCGRWMGRGRGEDGGFWVELLASSFEYSRADMCFDTVLVLAVLSVLAGVVAEDNTAFWRGDRGRMGIATACVRTFQPELAKSWRLRSLRSSECWPVLGSGGCDLGSNSWGRGSDGRRGGNNGRSFILSWMTGAGAVRRIRRL